MSLKIRILFIFFILLFSALAVRLFYWQVVKGSSLADQAKNQHSTSTVTAAPRGNILASDGTPWVARIPAWNIWANPRSLDSTASEVSGKLAPILFDDGEDTALINDEKDRLKTLLEKDVSWISLKQRVPDNVKKEC